MGTGKRTAKKTEKRKSPIPLFLVLLVVLCALALLLRSITAKEKESEEAITEETVRESPALPANTLEAAAFRTEDGVTTYTAGESHSGIDISEHQGAIDWEAVRADGIEFAIIRVGNRGTSEGGLHEDACFAENLSGALSAGLEVGLYFFSQAVNEEEAAEEARFVLSLIDGEEIAYPIFFDWETVAGGSRVDGMTSDTLTACAKAFCSTIATSGLRAGVYFSQSVGYNAFDLEELRDYAFWLAYYDEAPDFTYSFEIWQYTADGTVSGISGVVDRCLSFTDFKDE